jgi:hypothetical protein
MPQVRTRSSQKEVIPDVNLKEKSSGNTRGQLSITKRGPGPVRHLLFMAALRLMKTGNRSPLREASGRSGRFGCYEGRDFAGHAHDERDDLARERWASDRF